MRNTKNMRNTNTNNTTTRGAIRIITPPSEQNSSSSRRDSYEKLIALNSFVITKLVWTSLYLDQGRELKTKTDITSEALCRSIASAAKNSNHQDAKKIQEAMQVVIDKKNEEAIFTLEEYDTLADLFQTSLISYDDCLSIERKFLPLRKIDTVEKFLIASSITIITLNTISAVASILTGNILLAIPIPFLGVIAVGIVSVSTIIFVKNRIVAFKNSRSKIMDLTQERGQSASQGNAQGNAQNDAKTRHYLGDMFTIPTSNKSSRTFDNPAYQEPVNEASGSNHDEDKRENSTFNKVKRKRGRGRAKREDIDNADTIYTLSPLRLSPEVSPRERYEVDMELNPKPMPINNTRDIWSENDHNYNITTESPSPVKRYKKRYNITTESPEPVKRSNIMEDSARFSEYASTISEPYNSVQCDSVIEDSSNTELTKHYEGAIMPNEGTKSSITDMKMPNITTGRATTFIRVMPKRDAERTTAFKIGTGNILSL